jgi:hypothetical protein
MSTTLLSIVALMVSVLSWVFSYRAGQLAEKRSRMPVLVFEYDGSRGWVLRNVGNGPALNVVVAQKRPHGEWFAPVRVPSLPRDGEFALTWLGHVNDTGLGATYSDFVGAEAGQGRHEYTAMCGNDLSRVLVGRQLPRWGEGEINVHWRASGSTHGENP